MRKRIKQILKWAFGIILTSICAVILSSVVGRVINCITVRIKSDNGIQETAFIEVGGIKQYIQIRGEDTENPVILVLHGEPGSPMGLYSYYWQLPLEENYTIVHWDQRGSGRTFYANKNNSSIYPTTDLLLSDIDEIVDYLRNRFLQEKIIIMGHSWGTVLGSRYVQNHPGKVASYIGVGQVVDTILADKLSSEAAKDKAMKEGKIKTVSSIGEAYNNLRDEDFDLKELMKFRKLITPYLPSGEQMSGFRQLWMGITSPYMGVEELKWNLSMINTKEYFQPNMELVKELFQNEGVSLYQQSLVYQVPVHFISGNCDWVTPYTMVEEYYNKVEAPEKGMHLIDNAGHSPFLDKPEEFIEILKTSLCNPN